MKCSKRSKLQSTNKVLTCEVSLNFHNVRVILRLETTHEDTFLRENVSTSDKYYKVTVLNRIQHD